MLPETVSANTVEMDSSLESRKSTKLDNLCFALGQTSRVQNGTDQSLQSTNSPSEDAGTEDDTVICDEILVYVGRSEEVAKSGTERSIITDPVILAQENKEEDAHSNSEPANQSYEGLGRNRKRKSNERATTRGASNARKADPALNHSKMKKGDIMSKPRRSLRLAKKDKAN